MLNEKQIERMLGKLAKFEEKLGTMLFVVIMFANVI